MYDTQTYVLCSVAESAILVGIPFFFLNRLHIRNRVRIIEVSDNRGTDNRGKTIIMWIPRPPGCYSVTSTAHASPAGPRHPSQILWRPQHTRATSVANFGLLMFECSRIRSRPFSLPKACSTTLLVLINLKLKVCP